MTAIDEAGAITFAASEAECTAQRVVAEVGAARLTELGADQDVELTRLGWTADERAAVFVAIRRCVDLPTQLTDLFSADPTLSLEQAACIAQAYSESEVFPEAQFSTAPDPAVNGRVDNAIDSAYEACT